MYKTHKGRCSFCMASALLKLEATLWRFIAACRVEACPNIVEGLSKIVNLWHGEKFVSMMLHYIDTSEFAVLKEEKFN